MIGRPLRILVQNCRKIENGEDLKIFEEMRLNKLKYKLREKLKRLRMQSEFLILRANDMQDWQRLNQRIFKKISTDFSLKQLLKDAQDMILFKSSNCFIRFRLFAYFDSKKDLNMHSQIEIWKQKVQSLLKNKSSRKHPLLK